MKFEIYTESAPKPEPTVRLALREGGDGDADVVTVGENGYIQFYLVTFKADGTMRRARNIDPKLGFQLDNLDRIAEVE